MGCTSSKLDDLPAVALCRERCTFLDEAIRQRYVLAEAHVAYMQSLKRVGFNLHKFFDEDLETPLSPALHLPQDRKIDSKAKFIAGEGSGMPKTGNLHHLSHSNSGSHLQFHDSDDDDSSGGSLHHSGDSSPLHHHMYDNQYVEYGMDHETTNSYPSGFMQMNYMKNQATPSISYEQLPMSPQVVHMGQSSYYPYSNDKSYNGYSNYDRAASSSQPPPPMPPPESSSPWDIFNPFEYDKYYSAYTPSRDSKELREEEGIPDLEEEDDYRQEIVKEVYQDQKFVNGGNNYLKLVVNNDNDKKVSDNNETLHKSKPSTSIENEGMEYEVHVVDKKVIDNEKPEERSKVGPFKGRGGTMSVMEVVKEIQVQFERASESGNELAMMLEVGKYQHNRKHGAHQVSSRMLHLMTPSLPVVSSQPSTSSNLDSSLLSVANPNSILSGFEEETGIKLKNISSTLQKLYLWEKKLYNEVKAEEKMRVVHDKKCQKLQRMDRRGAESDKVETTRILIRSLSTKIKMAIQVVDRISVTINKIRDEELWPLLNEFIQGLTRMWKSMLECHTYQCQAIKEARSLNAIASRKKPGDAHLEATMQLELELINWTLRFSNWSSAQKGYIRALNNWLLKCIYTEPEETADGIAPFSPGRIGAPPIFVICNQWAQSMDGVSEKEVLDSMRRFTNTVLQFWDKDKLVLRRNMIENKDMEKKVRNLDKEDQKIQKEIQALEKKMIMVSDESVNQSDTGGVNSFQECLQHVFEAMERYGTSSVKVYEEILQRSVDYTTV